jgi:Dyp-type peroxidase family
MPARLDTPAKDVDLTSDQYDVMLGNLQANILKAHGRDFARHLFVRFTGRPAAVKAWISDLAPSVTTAKEQLAQLALRHADASFAGDLVTGMFLSAKGYEFLGFDTERFASDAFRKGLKDQDDGFIKDVLEDVLDTSNKDPEPDTWEPGFQREIHALITVAHDDAAAVNEASAAIRESVTGVGDVLTIEEGVVLRRTNPAGRLEPVEHFGYFDGISNPLFTQQDLETELTEIGSRDTWDAGARLSLVLTDDPHTTAADAFGSYLVYRKLGQDVNAFNQRVSALAASLSTDEELAGAMVVGRFKDGTPVLHGTTPSPGPEVANDFNFAEDRNGLKCPFQAHIRKVNPRGTTPLTSLESERRRRIVRRGIPYGKPMPGVADTAESDADPRAERGLLFMCFQRNIEEQFEFVQRTWADNEHFPSGLPTLGLLQKDTGDDPLIGQDPDEAQRWPKAWGEKGKKAFNFESAVTLKGGEYFFAPSIPFLRSL